MAEKLLHTGRSFPQEGQVADTGVRYDSGQVQIIRCSHINVTPFQG